MRHAVFPGGGRVRPTLSLRVSRACGDDTPELSNAAAAAIELLHCASLVHDDLPCFDDAETRRGLPSVHRAFGEQLAVLAGDALIILAFETIAAGAEANPARLPQLMQAVVRGVGPRSGIIGGQAWESEPDVDLRHYHATKTGALFEAAVTSGALAAGADPTDWRVLGIHVGEAYQIADDLHDAAAHGPNGKPVGRDETQGRPNAVLHYGLDGALSQLNHLRRSAVASVPAWASAADFVDWINEVSFRLVPEWLREKPAARPLRRAAGG